MSAGPLLILLLCALLLVGVAIVYNRLVGLRNACRNAFARVDAPLKQRHDLVPPYLDALTPHGLSDSPRVASVVAARHSAAAARAWSATVPLDAHSLQRLDAAESALAASLASLQMAVQANPGARSDRTVSSLTTELGQVERRIAFVRRSFNDAVHDYNRALSRFPVRILGMLLGFRPADALLPAQDDALLPPNPLALSTQ